MLGGVIEAISLQPLDVVKTRLQLSQTSLPVLVKEMALVEGPKSFYKGLSPFVTHLVTKYSVRFYFNEFYRGLLADENGKVSQIGGLLAGTGSGITEAVLIVTPFEVIKTRLQQQKGTDKSKLKYQGPVHTAQTIIKEEGVAALWKGNVPTMLRQGINQLFLFGVYDNLKKAVYGLDRDAPINSYQSLTLGIIAGGLGPLFNNPVDVAKTRLMAQLTAPGETPKYTGTFQCMARVAREEGASALMRGCVMRIARVAPGMGITFTVVEKFSERFSQHE
eukprot:TRINITY_DN13336_c0_g1_i1.p1 TRINITY_DN13336_c0_g1~~TRINITY_DN13336_c0_g1_i1.p1  ORF type:complete len:309 (-),score=84.65 TRINITY_DN13336_c0_g1_i1:25-855(-)